MLRSKSFWIAISILVPFVIIWVMEGLGWAIATLVTVGVLFLIVLGSTGRKRRIYYYDEYDDDEEEIIVERRPRRTSSIETAAKWHIPKVNQKGVEFITGSKSIRRSETDAMRKMRKRLWG